jgi:hypothetical protein
VPISHSVQQRLLSCTEQSGTKALALLGAPFHHGKHLRCRLQEALPAGLQVQRVRAGVAVLSSPALFVVRLTLVPAPDEDAVLARCGASSGAAPSPAPSNTATVAVSLKLCCAMMLSSR